MASDSQISEQLSVLVIDDDPKIREYVGDFLTARGHTAHLAEDGREALAAAREQRPDLILMDMSLPVVDGWEATRQLKAEEATKAIPVIALTAHAMASDEQKARAAGGDEFDTKPIELPRLLRTIEAPLAAD